MQKCNEITVYPPPPKKKRRNSNVTQQLYTPRMYVLCILISTGSSSNENVTKHISTVFHCDNTRIFAPREEMTTRKVH